MPIDSQATTFPTKKESCYGHDGSSDKSQSRRRHTRLRSSLKCRLVTKHDVSPATPCSSPIFRFHSKRHGLLPAVMATPPVGSCDFKLHSLRRAVDFDKCAPVAVWISICNSGAVTNNFGGSWWGGFLRGDFTGSASPCSHFNFHG